ncbi:hypothetical protein BG005_003992, partial [Podila minutissima]
MESDENLLGGHSYNRYSGSSGSSAGASSRNALGETEEQSANGNRPSFSIGSPVLLSAPTKKPKERRSKSVIFNSQHTGARAATAVPATASTEPRLGRACETKAVLAEQQHASGVNSLVHNLVASLWADDVAARGVVMRTGEHDHSAATQAEALGPFATPAPPPPPQVAVQDSNEAVVPYIVEPVVTVSGGSARAGGKTPPLGIGLGLQAPD